MDIKISLKLESINKKCLFLYIFFLTKVFSLINCKYTINFLPKKTKRITFLKSPHVFKKSKEHFEISKYKIIFYLKIKNNTLFYLKTLLLNKPNTIKSKIVIN